MKHWKLKAVLATLLVFVLYVVFQHPNLNPLYPESAFMYCVLITVLVAIFTLGRIGRVVAQPGPVQGVPGSVRFERFQNGSRWPLILVAVLWGAYFIVWAGSSVLFQVNAFRDQMPELVQMDFAEDFDTTDTSQLPIVDKAMAQKLADKKLGERPSAFRDQMPELVQMDFAEDFDTTDTSQLPIVDKAMAQKLADKKLGERPSLGSQVVLGEPTLQQVNGKLVWAVPTYHSGVFKWLWAARWCWASPLCSR